MASELIVRQMYNDEFTLTHNPVARGSQPRYVVTGKGLNNGMTKPKGVTTILGQTLSKDLMQWSVDCMEDYLKDKVPHITEQDLKDGKDEYKTRRDSGASTGSEAHALVEDYLKGRQPSVGSASKEAALAYKAFVEWFESVAPEVINVEEVIYSMTYNYAGTYDAMLRINGQVYLVDLKTTNVSRKAPKGVYAEYFAQLGGYALAHEEQRIFEEENGGSDLLPIDGLLIVSAKKNGKLDLVSNEDVELSLSDCVDTFRQVHNIYNFLTGTTKLLGGK